MEGFIFGLVDNGVVLLGAYLGLDIESKISSKLSRESNPVIGAAFGATIANLISDVAGAYLDPSMNGMITGIALGCLIPIICIPFIEKIKAKWADYWNGDYYE